MKFLNGNNWKALLLLSIVVPVSLLASFKLTGLLGEPATITETITLQPVTWMFGRPYNYTVFDNNLQAPYSSDCMTGTFELDVVRYAESEGAWPASVCLVVGINLTTNKNVSIENVYLTFNDTYGGSDLVFQRTNVDYQFVNLSLVEIVDGSSGVNNYAYISLAGLNHPSHVYLSWVTYWELSSLHTQDHELNATYEVTYYNGTSYNEIVQPFIVQISGGTKP